MKVRNSIKHIKSKTTAAPTPAKKASPPAPPSKFELRNAKTAFDGHSKFAAEYAAKAAEATDVGDEQKASEFSALAATHKAASETYANVLAKAPKKKAS